MQSEEQDEHQLNNKLLFKDFIIYNLQFIVEKLKNRDKCSTIPQNIVNIKNHMLKENYKKTSEDNKLQ